MTVSVVIAAYNASSYIPAAVESILNQTLTDLECIVIDDGSIDQTLEVLADNTDPRLRTFQLPVNCGIAAATNLGIRLAKGEYIAVMDADDIAMPERLQLQVDFLQRETFVHFVGGAALRVADDGTTLLNPIKLAATDAAIKAQMMLVNGSALLNPTTMGRADFIRQNGLYYPPLRRGQEQGMWAAAVRCGANFANLNEVLLRKRRHKSNVTNQFSATDAKLSFELRQRLVAMYYPTLTHLDISMIARMLSNRTKVSTALYESTARAVALAQTVTKSFYGESKPRANLKLQRYLERLERS